MRLRLASAIFLAALLVTGGPARAARAQGEQQQAAETLTPDERREAGEFLLSLDARWAEGRDLPALFDEAFVGDFLESSRDQPDAFPFLMLDGPLRGRLNAAERRRAHVAGLDLIYMIGRLSLAFERAEENGEAAGRAAPASPAAGGVGPPRAGEKNVELSLDEMLLSVVAEEFKNTPLPAALVEGGGGEGKEGGGEDPLITTHGQLDELLSALERATRKMRSRAKELEADLPGGALSAVPREDEDEGEWPELRLMVTGEVWKNRPAGTRVVCGYLANLHVELVKEGGRYKVLAAHVED